MPGQRKHTGFRKVYGALVREHRGRSKRRLAGYIVSHRNPVAISESRTIEQVLYLLRPLRYRMATGDDRTDFEVAMDLLVQLGRQAKAGQHRNPSLTLVGLGNPGGKKFGKNVHEVKYEHVTEGYRVHKFERAGTCIYAMPDGSLRIANPKCRLWVEA
jgi:hypothetical protein